MHKNLMAALLPLAIGLTMALSAMAETEREAGAHEHGHGQLHLAAEGGRIEMELKLTGKDVVGFGHVAHSEADKSAVTSALEKLKDAKTLFQFDGGNCALVSAAASLVKEVVEEDHDDEAGEHKDGHDDGDKKDAHGEDHEGKHSEYIGTYSFKCEDAKGVKSLTAGVFKAFPALKELDVRMITSKGQTKAELEPDSPDIAF